MNRREWIKKKGTAIRKERIEEPDKEISNANKEFIELYTREQRTNEDQVINSIGENPKSQTSRISKGSMKVLYCSYCLTVPNFSRLRGTSRR